MSLAAIVIVDPDREALAAVEQHVRRRYEGEYRVVGTASPAAALEVCRQLQQCDEQLALLLVVEGVAGERGTDVLARARAAHPNAGRVLMTTNADVEAAMLAVNETGLHGYLVTPPDPPETKLYPVLDELLADWRERQAVPYLVVEAVMDTDDAVPCIPSEASLFTAAHMVASTQVGDLMVVGDGNTFVGVLSEGDILRNALPDFEEIVGAGGTPHDAYQLFVKKAQALSAMPILPLVIREPIVLRPGDHVAQAATILIDRQIRRIPVVEDATLLGTVSRANICRAVVGRS